MMMMFTMDQAQNGEKSRNLARPWVLLASMTFWLSVRLVLGFLSTSSSDGVSMTSGEDKHTTIKPPPPQPHGAARTPSSATTNGGGIATLLQQQVAQLAKTSSTSRSAASHPKAICSPFFTGLRKANAVPLNHVWDSLFPRILKSSVDGLDGLADNPEFLQSLAASGALFNHHVRRKSVENPARHEQVQAVMEIVNRKLQNPADSNVPPLKIVVFGGSATSSGVECVQNLQQTVRDGVVATTSQWDCSWPGRLQRIMDELYGPGIIQVTNIANGAATSDLSAAVMQYDLFPLNSTIPDVIFWDHGFNEAHTHNEESIRQNLRTFQESTRSVRCDPKLPLVAYIDSLPESNSPELSESLFVSNTISSMASWYDTMAVSYSKAIRASTLSHSLAGNSKLTMFGDEKNHFLPGLGHHVSLSWVVAYNWLNALADACSLRENGQDVVKQQSSGGSRPDELLPVKDIPHLKPGRARDDMLEEWETRAQERRSVCAASATQADTDGSHPSNTLPGAPKRSVVCSYSWMSNRLTDVRWPRHLRPHVEPYATEISGWVAKGKPVKSPRTAWVATQPRAYFVLEIPITQPAVVHRHFTLMSLARFGLHDLPELEVSVTRLIKGRASLQDASMVHRVPGYSTSPRGELVHHKLSIPEAREGDVIRIRFELVEGDSFTIHGMALCT